MSRKTVRERLRGLLKRIAGPLMQRGYRRYARSRHVLNLRGFRLTVLPGVFHPRFFLSTGLLCEWLEAQRAVLPGKSLLELGCGTGLVSLTAARLGAAVTASDLNPAAVQCAAANAARNGLAVDCVESDLFTAFAPETAWDLVVINPPYYPQQPENMEAHAWYCGADFEYFRRLFAEMQGRIRPGGMAWMILSEDCALAHIQQLARTAGWDMQCIHTWNRWLEVNFIFRLQPQVSG